MVERGPLLARQHQTVFCRAGQRPFPAAFRHAVPLAFRHHLGGALQPLFSLDHAPRCEPILAAPVLAQGDEIRRAAHRAHRGVELLLPVTVTMNENRHIAAGECRLLVVDSIEGDTRFRDDSLAIAPRDLAVILDPFGFQVALAHALRGRANLVLRFKIDTLSFQRTMIDARIDIEFGKTLVDVIGPALTPLLDQLRAVPVAHLRAEPVAAHLAHGEHDMGMGFGQPVRADVPMHIEVGDHASIDNLGSNEIAGKLDALRLRQFAGNGELHLSR